MESCVVVCNRRKAADRKGKVLFIDALNEVTRERAQSFLKPEHQERILQAFQNFTPEPGFASIATLEQIAGNGANLSIPLYVKKLPSHTGLGAGAEAAPPATLAAAWAHGKATAARSGSRWTPWSKPSMVWTEHDFVSHNPRFVPYKWLSRQINCRDNG